MARRIEISPDSKVTKEEEKTVKKTVKVIPKVVDTPTPRPSKQSKYYTIKRRPKRYVEEVEEVEEEEDLKITTDYFPSYRHTPSFSFGIDWLGAGMSLAFAFAFVTMFLSELFVKLPFGNNPILQTAGVAIIVYWFFGSNFARLY